jgi:tyrosyl-tRNA synthetase
MWRYFDLISLKSGSEISTFKHEILNGRNPRDVKVELALEIVDRFHDKAAAQSALADFELRFKQGGIPEVMPEVTLHSNNSTLAIAALLKQANLVASSSEGIRLIEQGGVKVDAETIHDKGLILPPGNTYVIQVGKRKFARVTLT